MFEHSPTLRYFDCRGRAQHFRYYFLARDIAFTDDRIALDENWASWSQIKENTSLTGPFHKLPVLQIGELQVAETRVIHDWLHELSGDRAMLTAEQQLQHAMLASSCFSEIMMPLGLLIYCDLMHPGTDVKQQVIGTIDRTRAHLQSIDRVLAGWQWTSQRQQRPVMLTDCLLWEGLNEILYMLPGAIRLEDYPALLEFYETCPGRQLFLDLLEQRSMKLTGRPHEADMIGKIQEIATSLG